MATAAGGPSHSMCTAHALHMHHAYTVRIRRVHTLVCACTAHALRMHCMCMCRWDVALELPLFLSELAHVLRPGGRAVLLMAGYNRVASILSPAEGGGEAGLALVARRRVNVGGFGCWALTLEAR